jgi:large subunit ribosomal protein L4
MIRLALLSALSDRAADGKVLVVSGWGLEAPSTKAAKALLDAIGATGKALVVVAADEILAAKSFRNLPNVHVLLNTELNAYDVLCSDVVVFTPETLPKSGHDQPVSVATSAPDTAAPAAAEEAES